MTDMMTAVEITEPGGPEVLKPTTRPVPTPGPGQVLIKVAAAGVNRPDVAQRAGAYPPPPGASDLPGLEVAGTVDAIGPDATRWRVGDTVCGLTPGGGYAEYCVTHQDHCLPIPTGYSMIEAAALPETFFTVYGNVFMRGRLTAGEWLLLHGGSSGIGTTAIQLAKRFGAHVITTVGNAEKAAACAKLGADAVINYKQEDWPARVAEITEWRGVDLVLDMVAGDYIQPNLNALAMDGRYVFIAFLNGPKAALDITRIMIKRLTVTGSTLRPQTDAMKAEIARNLLSDVWPMLEAGTVAPQIHATFPLAEAAKAHALMESSSHIGKIMLMVG
ncbi:MAG: NAD(P)H-quinone oxidoreductase [Alphaproteobacteria bacterium]|nr:NAD(P)H-quinone oxidoreductase [Alphaproteobacteria bacterium]